MGAQTSVVWSRTTVGGWKTTKTGTQLDSRGITQDWSTAQSRITWNDNIRKDIESSGVTWEEALLLMTYRNEWRSWIAQCARHGMD